MVCAGEICTPEPKKPICTLDEMQCSDNGLCVNKKYICDGIKDCLNGEDETNCSKCLIKFVYVDGILVFIVLINCCLEKR